jgi:uncharacterized lipoprotein YmbA
MKSLVLAVVGLACLAGCGISLGPKELPPTVYYHLDLPEPLPASRRIDLDIVLTPFSQAAALERDGIRYRTSDVEGGYWLNHRWGEPVGDMVRDAVQTDLRRSGLFRRVLILDQAGYSHVLLTGDVIRWEEEDREDGWYAVVEVDFALVMRAAPDSLVGVEDRVVLSRRYRRDARAAAPDVAEVVRALSSALSGILADLRKDLETVIGEETP